MSAASLNLGGRRERFFVGFVIEALLREMCTAIVAAMAAIADATVVSCSRE